MPSSCVCRFFSCSLLLALVPLSSADLRAAEPFQDTVLPFVKTYCVRCHNAKTARGELDLARFTSMAKVIEDFRHWENVVAFLKKEEMPPAKAKQPPAAVRADIVATLEQVLLEEARKIAGDPGVVPPRRLSNAEYNYTIQDLTGVDIQPAKSFPVDPASGEGFNNTGEALTMSPSLFKKYYTAAEFVADHALLTSSGLTFAPHPVVAFADRRKYYEQAILRFYDRHAVDYEKYLTALWLYRHRPPARKAATLEDCARDNDLSPRYARSLWQTLQSEDAGDRFFLPWLRQRWRALPSPRNPMEPTAEEIQPAVRALTADIQRLSRQLCPPETPAIVPNAGNSPIEHLARRRRMAESRDTLDPNALRNPRFTLTFPNATQKPSIKIVVQITPASDTKADGFVVLDGVFTTNNQTTDGKRKWLLRQVLAEHAPEQLAKVHKAVRPPGEKRKAEQLVLSSPCLLELDIPTKAFPIKGKGSVTFTADCRLERSTHGIVLIRVLNQKAPAGEALVPSRPLIDPEHPIARQVEASGEAFCRLFPNRFYFADADRGLSAGFHLIEGFFRDDQPLCRHVLSDAEKRELDRLWEELYFVTGIWEKLLRGFVFFERSERNFLKHPDFDSFKEEDPELVKDDVLARLQEVYLKRSRVKAAGAELAKHPITVFFGDIRAGLRRHAETQKRAEAAYLRDLQQLAQAAYRRPLTAREKQKLETFFNEVCRDKDHGVETAVRASIARILVSPHFC
ncbi:MAG TPA: DUF1587 domain-containing protein, partial [Gemmataceae bacterium]|nr:DUF1587 domain-containing protein [Gemmataceae bacterium]